MTVTFLGQKCILYSKKEKKILLIKRSNYSDDEECWDFIGGGVEFGEDSKDAIKREAKEETNLFLNSLQIIDIHSRLLTPEKFFIFALYFSDNFEGEIKLSSEHTEYKWISIKELDNYKLRSTVEHVKEIIKKYISNLSY